MTPEKFVEIHTLSESIQEVARKTGMSEAAVRSRERNYRNIGVQLRRLPLRESNLKLSNFRVVEIPTDGYTDVVVRLIPTHLSPRNLTKFYHPIHLDMDTVKYFESSSAAMQSVRRTESSGHSFVLKKYILGEESQSIWEINPHGLQERTSFRHYCRCGDSYIWAIHQDNGLVRLEQKDMRKVVKGELKGYIGCVLHGTNQQLNRARRLFADWSEDKTNLKKWATLHNFLFRNGFVA